MKIIFASVIPFLCFSIIHAQVKPKIKPVVFKSVNIGKQTWMVKNLDLATYRNGDPIPKVTDKTAWAALSTGAYCYFENDSATYAATYGKIYNSYAVNDPRGLAPKGWHVPSDTDWTRLSDFLGGEKVAGGKMKEADTTHWRAPNRGGEISPFKYFGATNSSGFTGLPGGYRNYFGNYENAIYTGYWWSSTDKSKAVAWNRILDFLYGDLKKASFNKVSGMSVRCIKD
jgi:uncharacterized protein (TIGR02145 family)